VQEIVDFWHLNRERILQVGGIVLCLLAVALVLADGLGARRDAHETGTLIGAALGYSVLPIIVASLAVYALRRFYWHEEGASWKQTPPAAWALAGVIAMVLAVGLGAPQTKAERARSETLAAVAACAKQSAAVAANLPSNSTALSSAAMLRANPRLADASSELRDGSRMYVWRSGGAQFVLSTFPIPADRVGDQSVLAQYFEGVSETMTPEERDRAATRNRTIAGRPAYQINFRGSSAEFVAVLDGCHAVTLEGNTLATSAVMSRLLGGTPGAS